MKNHHDDSSTPVVRRGQNSESIGPVEQAIPVRPVDADGVRHRNCQDIEYCQNVDEFVFSGLPHCVHYLPASERSQSVSLRRFLQCK